MDEERKDRLEELKKERAIIAAAVAAMQTPAPPTKRTLSRRIREGIYGLARFCVRLLPYPMRIAMDNRMLLPLHRYLFPGMYP